MNSKKITNMFKNSLVSEIPDALNIVLCPFAGGSSGSFRNWFLQKKNNANIFLATYPGREHRMNESFANCIEDLAKELIDNIYSANLNLKNTVLVGHSMGAQVAYEACKILEVKNTPPAGIVISACHAPHLQGHRLLSHLDDNSFIQQLVKIGGISEELLRDSVFLKIFLPMLRADFQTTESYCHPISSTKQKLSTPALLIYGSKDQEASKEEVASWSEWLYKSSEPVEMSGEHFYITQQPQIFINHILSNNNWRQYYE